ncbi:MAG: Mrp/NBP35 family ATP-binding protein [Phycisphaerales bacterium JB040]
MPLHKDQLLQAANSVQSPDTGRPLAEAGPGLGAVWAATQGPHATLRLCLPENASPEARARVAADVEIAVRRVAMSGDHELDALHIQFVNHAGEVIDQAGDPAPEPAPEPRPEPKPEPRPGGRSTRPDSRAPTPQDASNPLPGVRHIVAVGAGKGGVGKSTVAVNLAVALARRGHAVGLLDADIYGPSMPTMLGLGALDPIVNADKNMEPFLVHGVKAATIGKLVDSDKPLIWRGPMAHGAFTQLTQRTNWGELDHLIIDLPPGTGDVPLSLAQSLRCSGAVIVCTPQRVAQDDAVRAANMFKQLGVPVLGVVENMSYFVADPDSDGVAKTYDIFGRGGAEQMAQRLGLPFLGAVPINMALRENLDRGEPLRNFDPATAGGDDLPRALETLTNNLTAQLALASMRSGAAAPTLNIS